MQKKKKENGTNRFSVVGMAVTETDGLRKWWRGIRTVHPVAQSRSRGVNGLLAQEPFGSEEHSVGTKGSSMKRYLFLASALLFEVNE